MQNKNYIKGRRKEYKIRNDLIKQGFNIVQRSAGSHSKIDIFAIDTNKKIIKFVQSKPDLYTASQTNKLLKELDCLNDNYSCSFIVM
jgi:Holliday junction resolvase